LLELQIKIQRKFCLFLFLGDVFETTKTDGHAAIDDGI